VAQGEGPKCKPQYHNEKRKKEKGRKEGILDIHPFLLGNFHPVSLGESSSPEESRSTASTVQCLLNYGRNIDFQCP
jgi:hypothetical protein